MSHSDKIIQLYMKSKDEFNRFESTPRDFGTGDLLYSSEIHTLDAIAKNEGINLTELANKLGISKSGTSKFIKKLINKKLIEKGKDEGNKKEVVFTLTDKGRVAVKGHTEFTQSTFGPILKLVDQLSDDEKVVMAKFLKDLNGLINDLNNAG